MKNENETTEMWREYRAYIKKKKAKTRENNTQELLDAFILKEKESKLYDDILKKNIEGAEIHWFTQYHCRITLNDKRVDYYPTVRKYHVIASGKRGVCAVSKLKDLFN